LPLEQAQARAVGKHYCAVLVNDISWVLLVTEEASELSLLHGDHAVLDCITEQIPLDGPRAAKEDHDHRDHFFVLFAYDQVAGRFVERLARVGIKCFQELGLELKMRKTQVNERKHQNCRLEGIVIEREGQDHGRQVAFVVLQLLKRVS
jgi:hypothetical protein